MTLVTEMKRDLGKLANNTYDLLVVGGGVYGACIAWDAALRGLSVALVEKGDFGHATSANSLKIVHGGLRYLQDADLGLMREMIHERTTLMRIAPHLVHPLPCIMPTYEKLTRSKVVMRTALAINDLVGLDRNQLADPEKHLPGGQILTRAECLRLLPGLDENGITGGAIWHDCQMHDSERLTLSFVLSAVKEGAEAANYVEVTGFLREGSRVTGVRARDVLTDGMLDIEAKVVVNATGPWVDIVLDLLGNRRADRRFHPSRAMNLITRQIIPNHGAGLLSNYVLSDGAGTTKRSRLLFVVPWRGFSMVGTAHIAYSGGPEDYSVTDADIRDLMDELNRAYPAANLKREDVYGYYHGYLPAMSHSGRKGGVRLVRRGQIHDHERDEGIKGLVTLVGVKYTTARSVAQKAVDLVFRKLGREAPRCLTAVTPVVGGQIERFGDFLAQEVARKPGGLDAETVRHLIFKYGSAYGRVLRYVDEDPKSGHRLCHSTEVIRAEVLHAVREEMAQKLADVIVRRTALGLDGSADEEGLRACGNIMASELGWDERRTEKEMDEVRAEPLAVAGSSVAR